MDTSMEKGEVIALSKVTTTDNYPYGSLRTEARFSIEFKPKFGFRHVFQTINPKTGRLNNPKTSSYGDVCYKYINPDNGHIEAGWLSCNGPEYINRTAAFMAKHFDALQPTPEMLNWIYLSMYTSIKISQHWSKELDFAPVIAIITDGLKTGKNVFSQIICPSQK